MSSNSKKQPALGRGLSALLQNSDTDITSMSGATVGSVSMIEIHLIEEFVEEYIKEIDAGNAPE